MFKNIIYFIYNYGEAIILVAMIFFIAIFCIIKAIRDKKNKIVCNGSCTDCPVKDTCVNTKIGEQ